MSGQPWVERPVRPVDAGTSTPVDVGASDSGPRPAEAGVHVGRVQIVLGLLVASLVVLAFVAAVSLGLGWLPRSTRRFVGGDGRGGVLAGAQLALLLLTVLATAGCSAAARGSAPVQVRGWKVLGVALGIVLVDEATQAHLSLAEALLYRFHPHGVQRYAWALLYLPVAVAVVLALVRDLRQVSRAVRRRLLPGLALLAFGGIVLQPITSKVVEQRGEGSTAGLVASVVADAAELAGVSLIFCAVLVAATMLSPTFTLRLRLTDRPWGR